MLTIMAMMLMGRLILNINTTMLESGFTKDMAEYSITGTSLGTSFLEYAQGIAFDEATADTFLTSSQSGSLTAAALLGPDAGETTAALFDDIDDYNNYVKIDTVTNSAIFKTRGKVEYLIVVGSTMSTTTTRTWNKLLTVYITSDYLVNRSVEPWRPDTLKFQSVFSYWYFR